MRAGGVADGGVRDGAAAEEGVARAQRRPGRGAAEVQPAERRRSARQPAACGHGRIFSMGSTRMPEAPARLEPGQQAPDLVGADDGVDRDHPGVGERDHRRRLEARAAASSSSPSLAAGAFIIRYLRPRAAITEPSIVTMPSSSAGPLATAAARW